MERKRVYHLGRRGGKLALTYGMFFCVGFIAEDDISMERKGGD